MRSCVLRNGIDPITVSRRNIQTCLLSIQHPEQYENLNYLCSLMTGCCLPNLSGIEEELVSDFKTLQQTYNELPKEVKDDRKCRRDNQKKTSQKTNHHEGV